jgi:predicted component of type VI protein secretion system
MNILRLNPEGGGAPIVIDQAVSRVGRDAASDVHLRDASVSRQHAEIERRGDDWMITDLNSGNGVRIDGKKIHETALLPGQLLHIGNLGFRVEIDRGDDGATMMLGRSPLLEEGSDRTLLAAGPPQFPVVEPVEPPPAESSLLLKAGITAVILIMIAVGAFLYRTSRRPKPVAPVAAVAVTPRPTPLATLTPEPTPAPTPTPTPRPTGTLLITSDLPARVLIDGRVVADLKALGLRTFKVAPGEHIVQFQVDGVQNETVVRVRVNEQTVVRRTADGFAQPSPTAQPSPSPTPR